MVPLYVPQAAVSVPPPCPTCTPYLLLPILPLLSRLPVEHPTLTFPLPILQSLLVCADVVPVTLDVSEEEVMFAFGLDNWDSHVEQVRGESAGKERGAGSGEDMYGWRCCCRHWVWPETWQG